MRGEGTEEKGEEGREEGRRREGRGVGEEGRGEEAFLVMWPRRLSALNPPLGFAPTWLRQVSPPPLLHMTTLTTVPLY